MTKPKVLCVVGATASGKTDYAIALAKRYGGEVVSCDSMQIYKGMNIGTAKPTRADMQGIPHHMLDFCDPSVNYSVADFVKDAAGCIEDILARGALPILCGGTGLYIDSLLNGIRFSSAAQDTDYRAKLKCLAEQKGAEAVYALLKKADPEAAAAIHPNNIKRVIRALEIIKTSGKSKAEFDRAARQEPPYDAEMFGMAWEREALYQRIDRRVDIMMERGLLEEVESLLEQGVPKTATSMQAIGYKEWIAYLEGKTTYEEAVDTIKRETRRYAKRQMTWFRRNPKIQWVNPQANIILPE